MRKDDRTKVKEWCHLSSSLPKAIVASQNKHLVNKSQSGLGLIYVGHEKQLIDLESIVLIQSGDINNTIAIIKRVRHLPDGGTVIGVQKLGENAVTIEITEIDNPTISHALFIPQLSSSNQTRFLLIAPELGVVGKKMLINNANQKFMISITQILKEFLDCKQVSFDVIQHLTIKKTRKSKHN